MQSFGGCGQFAQSRCPVSPECGTFPARLLSSFSYRWGSLAIALWRASVVA